METAVAMAFLMGRTLVLPPVQAIYLLAKVKLIRLHHDGDDDS